VKRSLSAPLDPYVPLSNTCDQSCAGAVSTSVFPSSSNVAGLKTGHSFRKAD
jgi:hypothetical protein